MIDNEKSRLWRNRSYRHWFIADTTTELGGTITTFVIPLLVLGITHEPILAGVTAACGTVANAISDLIGGSVADRTNRFKMLWVVSVLGVIASAGWLAVELTESASFVLLLLINILLAIRFGLVSSTSTAALLQVIDSSQTGRALAASQGRDASISMAGAPLGGFLLVAGGWSVAAAVVVCQALSAWFSFLLMRNRKEQSSERQEHTGKLTGEDPEGFMREAFAGFIWIQKHKEILAAILAAFFINFGISVLLITFIYSWKTSQVSTVLIGVLPAAAGAGMLLGALVAGKLVTNIKGGRLAIYAVLVAALSSATLIFAQHPIHVLIVLALCMFVAPAYNSVLMGYLLLAVPNQLLGRVNSAASLYSLLASAAAPIVVGFGIEHSNTSILVGVATVSTVLSLVALINNRVLRSIPKEAGWKEHVEVQHTSSSLL